MSANFYYYLDVNVFRDLNKSESNYKKFLSNLSELEKKLGVIEGKRKFISTPFSIIEYLGIQKRLKPEENKIREHIQNYISKDAFVAFLQYIRLFFNNEIENIYTILLEENYNKIASNSDEEKKYLVREHVKELWDNLITQEILKDDFKLRLSEALIWDFSTDWRNNMPKGYRVDIKERTSYLFKEGLNHPSLDSMNLIRLCKDFDHLIGKDMRRINENIDILVSSSNQEECIAIDAKKRAFEKRESIKDFRAAPRDIVDSDIIQLSVTGYKMNDIITPVISFTNDSPDKVSDRISILKSVLGVYYSVNNEHDQLLIEGFKQGLVISLTPSEWQLIDSKTINEGWLQKNIDFKIL